jgi:hypothetical protein
MNYTDEDMTGYLKAVIITVIFLLALSGKCNNSGNIPVPESKFTSDIHQTDVRAVLSTESTCFAVLFSVNKSGSNPAVFAKNKIAFDSRLIKQRLKTLGKNSEVIIPFHQLHINFQLIPSKQDDPPDLS